MHIKAGSEISTQYVHSMRATYARRPILRSKWYFDCGCDRCIDPTECGSYLLALLCTSLPGRSHKPCAGPVLSCNPLSGSSDWACQTCGCLYSADYVLNLVTKAAAMKDNPSDKDDIIQHYERTIDHFCKSIHPSHYLMIEMKEKLAQIYGNFAPYLMTALPRPLKERKIQVRPLFLTKLDWANYFLSGLSGLVRCDFNCRSWVH